VFGHVKLRSDGLVARALTEQLEHILLARGEPLVARASTGRVGMICEPRQAFLAGGALDQPRAVRDPLQDR
jgi:hypothetical protein